MKYKIYRGKSLKYLSIAIALFLSACVTSGAMGPVKYEPVVSQDKYREYTLTWAKASQGLKTRLYLRGLNDGGHLRICSYYVDDITGMQRELIRAWFDAAYFTYKGKDILSTRFVRGQPKSVDATAGCVTTETLMKDVSVSGIRIEGRKVTVSF